MPRCPDDDTYEGHYNLNYLEEKLVFDYTGFNFNQIYELDIFTYQALLRDAVIYKYMETAEGQKYLNKCWILEQTKPDRAKLRERFGKEG
ncbi:hypothetical protein EHE19_019155 [Ruminiclostridium herbifermentans]|uniref:Uncharacterized protein n=1 Tax=Ruminiclostridium herbifermentans TaxID=2488810 RepID=A0A4U7J9W5_9FIRM|nr:hypothetical protein EHE19_019155 [Ruminiclostridium herbifermentans]